MSWFEQHWQEVLTMFGIGGGSGVLGHRAMDKQQNKKIAKLQEEVNRIDSELKINTERDRQFREAILRQLDNIEAQGKIVMQHLLDKK